MTDERRKSLLLDSDLERIGEAFDQRQAKLLEMIGYNVTTPESREEIRKDHGFIRNLRTATIWVIGAIILGGIGAAWALVG